MMTIASKSNNNAQNPELIDRVRRLLARAYSWAALPYLAAGLLLIVAIVAGDREIQPHINAIESLITELGPWLRPRKPGGLPAVNEITST